MTSADGLTDTTATCGGTKPGGSHAWIIGRRSVGSRAISACRMATTRALEWFRAPHRRYHLLVDFGDADGYHKELSRLRESYDDVHPDDRRVKRKK